MCYSIFFNNFRIFNGVVPDYRQLSSLNNKTILLNEDIDPDLNVFNQLSSSCNYYLRSEITDCIESMCISNELSFIHISARSMVNKLAENSFLNLLLMILIF